MCTSLQSKNEFELSCLNQNKGIYLWKYVKMYKSNVE